MIDKSLFKFHSEYFTGVSEKRGKMQHSIDFIVAIERDINMNDSTLPLKYYFLNLGEHVFRLSWLYDKKSVFEFYFWIFMGPY